MTQKVDGPMHLVSRSSPSYFPNLENTPCTFAKLTSDLILRCAFNPLAIMPTYKGFVCVDLRRALRGALGRGLLACPSASLGIF
jgi:hypothetical protein